jgi:hypothetical protein
LGSLECIVGCKMSWFVYNKINGKFQAGMLDLMWK